MACLALAAASASSASAVSIEHLEKNTPLTISSSGKLRVRGNGAGNNIVCNGETTGSADFEDQAHGFATLEFSGCVGVTGSDCTSSGAKTGTIVTAPLEMDLAELPGAGIGIVFEPFGSIFEPLGSNFAKFNCGQFPVEWVGGVIGKITAPEYGKSTNQLDIEFNTKGFEEHEQQYTETSGGRKAHLESSLSGNYFVAMALVANISMNPPKGVQFELSSEDLGPYVSRTGGFPTSTSLLGESEVTLKSGTTTVKCTANPGGSGEFGSSTAGTAEIYFHNCKGPLGVSCTSAGQPTGTIKTGPLSMDLTPLAGGGAGIDIDSSGNFAEIKCSILTVKIRGNVLASISTEFNHLGQTLKFAVSGEETGLEGSVAGGAYTPASLAVAGVAITFGGYFGGGVVLRE